MEASKQFEIPWPLVEQSHLKKEDRKEEMKGGKKEDMKEGTE